MLVLLSGPRRGHWAIIGSRWFCAEVTAFNQLKYTDESETALQSLSKRKICLYYFT